MKKMMITVGFVFAITIAYSQNFWVIENQATGPTIVKIYAADNTLVSEQKLKRRVDISRKRDRKMLNKMVRQRDASLWSKR